MYELDLFPLMEYSTNGVLELGIGEFVPLDDSVLVVGEGR
jgi:hypothetical protein